MYLDLLLLLGLALGYLGLLLQLLELEAVSAKGTLVSLGHNRGHADLWFYYV